MISKNKVNTFNITWQSVLHTIIIQYAYLLNVINAFSTRLNEKDL